MPDHDEGYPDWEEGDPVPSGFELHCYDGDGESGPCEPTFWLEPIRHEDCPECHTLQKVVGHDTVWGIPPQDLYEGDGYSVSKLACGHRTSI
jgi:hypothetical protein